MTIAFGNGDRRLRFDFGREDAGDRVKKFAGKRGGDCGCGYSRFVRINS
jgi:hypothetical protein